MWQSNRATSRSINMKYQMLNPILSPGGLAKFFNPSGVNLISNSYGFKLLGLANNELIFHFSYPKHILFLRRVTANNYCCFIGKMALGYYTIKGMVIYIVL